MPQIEFNEMDHTATIHNSHRTYTMSRVHPKSACKGRTCVLHNPSNHPMKNWDLIFRTDTGLMERQCIHGVGHPDPDSLAFFIKNGDSWMTVHGCDGCCSKEGTLAT